MFTERRKNWHTYAYAKTETSQGCCYNNTGLVSVRMITGRNLLTCVYTSHELSNLPTEKQKVEVKDTL